MGTGLSAPGAPSKGLKDLESKAQLRPPDYNFLILETNIYSYDGHLEQRVEWVQFSGARERMKSRRSFAATPSSHTLIDILHQSLSSLR